jgi:hypothetical protein
MDPEQYWGWLALALTPGLGARMAGKLLREMGSPEAIFNASLTEPEGRHCQPLLHRRCTPGNH